MPKIPCATCEEICDNARRLYLIAKAIEGSPDIETKRAGLHCHKTDQTYDLELAKKKR